MSQQTLYNDLDVSGNIFAKNIIYTSGDQTISGSKIFSTGGGAFLKSEKILTNNPFEPRSVGNTSIARIRYLNSSSPFATPGSNSSTTGINWYLDFSISTPEQLSRHIRTQSLTTVSGSNPGNFQPDGTSMLNTTGVIRPYYQGISPSSLFFSAQFANLSLEDRLNKIESSGAFAILPSEKMGIGTYQASEKLHVVGNVRVDGGLLLNQPPTVNGTGILLSGQAITGIDNLVFTTGDQKVSGVKIFGINNNIYGPSVDSHILGGSDNIVSNDNSVIVGGCNNHITSSNSFIGGGYMNFITGHYSFIGGGLEHEISGDYSYVVGGRKAKIRDGDHGALVLADGENRDHFSRGEQSCSMDFAAGVYLRLPSFNGSKNQTGNFGELRVSGDYLYIATGQNTWGRTPISSF